MRFVITSPMFAEITAFVDRIEKQIYRPVADLQVTAWRTKEPVPFARRQEGARLQLRKGDAWGELFDCAWFNFAGTVPAEAGGQPTVLIIDFNGEGLVVDSEGNPRQCLTS